MTTQTVAIRSRFLLLFVFCILTAGYCFADIGVDINTCVSNLPQTGGICDFRAKGAQTAAATINLNKPVSLLLDGTQITVNGSPGIQISYPGVHILGVTSSTQLIQGTAGTNIIGAFASFSDFEVHGVSFIGMAGQSFTSSNNGIFLSASNLSTSTLLTPITRVQITGNTFSTLQGHAVYLQNANDVEVSDNVIWMTSGGIRFSAVSRGKIEKNVLRDTQLPTGMFTVAIGLDSTDPINNISYPPCSELQILNNTVQSYVNAQGIMVHAGARITIAGNMINSVMFGISLGSFNTTDTMNNITVTGNSYIGPGHFSNPPSTPNYGIFVGGGPTATIPEYIVIANNTVTQANLVSQTASWAGITLGYANDVIVSNNNIHDTELNGISLTNPNNHILIVDNSISNLSSQSGADTNGVYEFNGIQSGRIRSNIVYGATHGYRFDVSSPSLLFGINDCFVSGTCVVNSNNVTVTN